MKEILLSKITSNTVMPLSLIITAMGGVFWLTTLYAQVQADSVSIGQVREAQKDLRNNDGIFQKEVIDRLARIETEIKDRRK